MGGLEAEDFDGRHRMAGAAGNRGTERRAVRVAASRAMLVSLRRYPRGRGRGSLRWKTVDPARMVAAARFDARVVSGPRVGRSGWLAVLIRWCVARRGFRGRGRGGIM